MMCRDALDWLRITVIAEDTVPLDSPLLGQHGLAVWVEAPRGNDVFRVLFDVGQHTHALWHNFDCLRIDPSQADALLLSHCHYDHTRGTAEVLRRIGKRNFPLVAHPDIFRPHFEMFPSLLSIGMDSEDSREALEAAGAALILSRDPISFLPGLMTTGEVPRRSSYEKTPPTFRTLREGVLERDLMMDDLSLVASVKGRGLVILTGCAHAGIVNIVSHGMELFPGVPLEGIMGGLHLAEAGEDVLEKTLEDLKKLAPRWVAPGHCTGRRGVFGFFQHFREELRSFTSGSRILISAEGVEIA